MSSDAELVARAVDQATKHLQEEKQKLQSMVDNSAKMAEETMAAAEKANANYQRLMKEQEVLDKENCAIEVKQAEHRVLMKAGDAWMHERKDRLSKLDAIRVQVGALAQAHDARAAAQATSHASHALTLGIIGLTTALEEGRPLAPHVSALSKGGAGDELVEAALGSISKSAQEKGVPTSSQMEYQFRGGYLSHFLAKMAVSMKAERALADGNLAAAADTVAAAVQGTAAAAAAEPWLQGLRARAAADQTLQLLRTHASALAASLA
eukprot:gene6094-2691_t